MCIAFPARVLALDDRGAVVEADGRSRRASLLLQPEIEVGAWVLVAAGSVIRQIDAAEAGELDRRLKVAIAATPLASPLDDVPSRHAPGGPR